MLTPNVYRQLSLAVAALVAAFAIWQALSLAQRSSNGEIVASKPKTMRLVQSASQVLINKPEGPPRVATGEFDRQGEAITVSCSSCHSTREPNPRRRDGAALQTFHQGLTTAHGELTCLSCHNQNNYNTLRLADEKPVSYPNVMQLCAQCHGPQYRDYQNGSHGGMTGYWDIERGKRIRNSCIDCHDPHAPAYPKMHPAPGPNDRFLKRPVEHRSDNEEGGHS